MSVATTPVFDTKLVMLVNAEGAPYPKIALFPAGGACIAHPPPDAVNPPVIVIDIYKTFIEIFLDAFCQIS